LFNDVSERQRSSERTGGVTLRGIEKQRGTGLRGVWGGEILGRKMKVRDRWGCKMSERSRKMLSQK